jgi:hypothetical protein
LGGTGCKFDHATRSGGLRRFQTLFNVPTGFKMVADAAVGHRREDVFERVKKVRLSQIHDMLHGVRNSL